MGAASRRFSSTPINQLAENKKPNHTATRITKNMNALTLLVALVVAGVATGAEGRQWVAPGELIEETLP